jgi:excisionase family DNA binding protein
MSTQQRDFWTPEQVADYLQLNRETIYRYIREGRLDAYKFGRHYRIARESVDTFLDGARTRPPTALRDYSREEIDAFLEMDKLDDEALAVVERIRNAGK